MHNRQSGAAHIPIMFFLVLLLLFLGALGFAWVTANENGDLRKQRNDALADATKLRHERLLIDHYIEDIGNVIGKPGKYEGRGQNVYEGAELSNALLMNPTEVKKVIDEACKHAEVSVSSTLEGAFGSVLAQLDAAKQRAKDAEDARDKSMAEKAEVDKKFAAATTDMTKNTRDWAQSTEQARSQFESEKADKDRTIASLTEGLKSKADELNTAKEAAATKEKELHGEILTLKNHNSALVERGSLVKPADVPDGKVIAAQGALSTAFINLGRKDLLTTGIVFQVKNPNSATIKGYATVTKVEEERSQVTLTGVVDPLGDSVRAGDLLYNDLFSPRVTRTIFLMGRFGAPYNKPELAALLQRLGNKVVDKMVAGVDTVILGNDPINEEGDGLSKLEESDEYKKAVDLRVEFLYLNKIRDLIKMQ